MYLHMDLRHFWEIRQVDKPFVSSRDVITGSPRRAEALEQTGKLNEVLDGIGGCLVPSKGGHFAL